MAATTWDTGYMAAYLNVPQNTLDTIIDTPTADLVKAVLDAVAAKAHEHEEAQADNIRLEVELENVVRSAENRNQGLKATVDKALKDVNDLREKLNAEENSRSTLEIELQKAKSSSSTSSSEVESLHIRIATLEAANRDTVAVLESKSTANDALGQELQKQHQKGLELSQQISTLQQSVQNANSATSSAKFREQSLTQELEQAKRNNEWLDTELKTKSAESLKLRKEKGARIAELQRLNDESNATIDALKRTEAALRSRLDEVQKKAEDSLSKIQQLEEAAATAEEGFRQELQSSQRLAELQAQQAETHRNRLKEVEISADQIRESAANEISRYQQAVEAGRQEIERLENRIGELEAEIDRLEANASAQPVPASMPGTPRQGLNGSFMGRAGSPFGTPGSARGRSTITATQAIEELYKVKGLLATEKRRGDRLAAEIEEIMQGLEAKQPEIEELQSEHGRLQQEVIGMSKYVDQTGNERDKAKREARKAEGEAATAQAESNILNQQLRDLSAQVKMLLCEMDARERGLDAMTPAERTQLERLARGENNDDAFEGLTDTDRFITQRLTVFRNISELQQKNQELLRITRELGDKMESEEALAAKHQAAKDHDTVQILEKKIENYKDELKSMVTRSESYIKERDMFRRMLQHRGQFPAGSDLASMFGQSVDGNGVMSTVEQSPQGKDNANYATLLRELQSHFDQYREEQTIDRRTLKEQNDKLASEKGSLQSEIAKINSHLTFASERYEMLQANFTMLQKENSELQKRSHVLSESASKQDLRTQQVAEDLIEAKGVIESMRNENANLKAEKKLWKDVQDRLNQDNENLMNERSRLNTLIANQQSLQNERELSESEMRRRLQTQVEGLESELNATKRKLNDEVEDGKKAQLRKDYDAQQNQKRIDDLVTNLSSVREDLVATKTTRDHLQARVDELTIELKSAEERVEVLQPRPTPRPGSQEAAAVSEASISREQELSLQVSELTRDLDLAKGEVETMRVQMEQYKAISQSSEEELESMNETQEQYRQEMDSIIEEKDARIRELQQRIDDISAELSASTTELNTLRNQQGETARHHSEEKAALEAEIVRLKDEDERHATAAQFHQQDLRAQAEIATKAQQDYENELVKHALAAQSLQNLRKEFHEFKTEAAELKAEAESSRITLKQSQSSWDDQREQFLKELAELRTRRDDVGAQNKLLLQQLENVSAQVAALQQNRAAVAETSENDAAENENVARSIDGLRELVTYLRRDKEIVDVQYDLSLQETKRLRQHLEHAQSQLDEARLKLDQERRAQANDSRSSLSQRELMEKIAELNTYRESTTTLRNETRQAQVHLAEKTKQIEDLLATIQPLETKVRELENVKEMQDGEMRLLQEDRDRWQKRNGEILSKYERIDPAEMEQLKESVTKLTEERDGLVTNQQPLQEQITTLEGEKSTWGQTRQKIIEQAKERNRVAQNQKADLTAERDAAIAKNGTLEQELSTVRQELDSCIQEKQATEQRILTLQDELSTSRLEVQPTPANTAAIQAGVPEAQQSNGVLEEQLSNIRKELELVTQQKHDVEQQLQAVREELVSLISERDSALANATQPAAPASDAAMQNSDEAGLISEGQSAETDANAKALNDRALAAEAKLKEIIDGNEALIKRRSETMKTALNKKLQESKAALEADFKKKLEDEKARLAEEAAASASSSTTVPPPADAPLPSDDHSHIKPEPRTAASIAEELNSLPDTEVRSLLVNNPTIRSIISSNVKKMVETEKQKVVAECETVAAQKLAEAEKKAEDSKTQAVIMEGKKGALKMNMTANQRNLAVAKLAVVEKAATETPQKPVVEVWTVAKDTKAPPAAAPIATPAVQPKPAAIPSPGAAPASAETKSQLKQLSNPPPTAPKSPTAAPVPQGPGRSAIPQPPASNLNGSQNSNGAPSGIPGPSSQQTTGVRQTGLPVPNRGGGNSRGNRGNMTYQARGGSIRGRGGSQRGSGSINPAAAAFSPGNKRPGEDGPNGHQPGNDQKRIRGGGGNAGGAQG